MNYERHPLSALFSQYDLGTAALEDMAEDIAMYGIREPIKLFDGMILDGWNRYCAAKIADVLPVTRELPDDIDPWQYVLSSNVHRRHMTAGEIAAVYLLKQQHDNPSDPNGSPKKSNREVAEELNVSYGTAQRIGKVAGAAPEVKQAVIERKVSLDDAAKVASLPVEQQAEAIKQPRQPKPEPQKSAEEQLMDDAFGALDPVEELEKLTAEYQQALRTIANMQADDQLKQIATLSDTVAGLEARLADKMLVIDRITKAHNLDSRILSSLCKELDVDHPKHLLAAVRHMMKEKL